MTLNPRFAILVVPTNQEQAAMTEEEEFKLNVRIFAAEILAVNLLAVSLITTGDAENLLARVREQMLAAARLPFPGVDAAQSDMYSSELESAIGRLMGMVSAQISLALRGLARKT